MICYRDRAYCSAKNCINEKCDRYVTEKIREDAANLGLGIAYTDFSKGTISEDGEVNEGCLGYREDGIL